MHVCILYAYIYTHIHTYMYVLCIYIYIHMYIYISHQERIAGNESQLSAAFISPLLGRRN